MSDLYVIVDDRDTSISWGPISSNGGGGSFNSGWTYGGSNAEFMYTTIRSGYVGSTMSFWFNGTSVSVYATLDNNPITTFNFTVDGAHASIVAQNISGTMYHQPVYSSGTLDDGEHHLELTVPSADDSSGTIEPVIDYIIYTPSQNTSLSQGSPYLFVDDTSPYIHYSSSGWTQNSPLNFESESDMSYNNSISMASSSNAQATLYFQGSDTEATILEAWGAIPTSPNQTAILSYTTDNSVPSTVNIPPSTSASRRVIGDLAWNYQLFNVSVNGGGIHTLTLTALQPNLLYLDFFLVMSPIAFIPTGNAAASFPSPLSFPSSSPSSSSSSLPLSNSSSHMGAIVGGTISGTICIAFILIAFILNRRKQQEGKFDPPIPSKSNHGQVINTIHGPNDLSYARSHSITGLSTSTMPIGYNANQPSLNGLTSLNNLLDEHRLSLDSGIMGGPPQMQNMIQSSWLPLTPAPIASVTPCSVPAQSILVLPSQQTGQSQGISAGKASIPPNDGMREHELTMQELNSGYDDPTSTMISAPPLYTYK